MRLTEFWERMTRAFGAAYVDSVSRDQSMAALDRRTVREALEAGEDPKTVWRVVVEQFDVDPRLR